MPSTFRLTLAGLFLLILLGFLPVIELHLVVRGLFLGLIIGVGATGLTLIYGTFRFPNIAQGEFMTLGAYVSLFLLTTVFANFGLDHTGLGPFSFGYPLFLALPFSLAGVAAGAMVLDWGLFRVLRRRGAVPALMAVISLGILICLRGLVQMLWGGEIRQFPHVPKSAYELPMDVQPWLQP